MRTNFVLIDSENVKPKYIERLKHEHFQVVVFVGARLKWLDFPIVNAVQSLGSNGSYVQVSSHGPNALDFHIAYYIGKLSAAHPGLRPPIKASKGSENILFPLGICIGDSVG